MPGVGQKSAQRIAFHLLERDREGASQLSAALAEAMAGIGHCRRCRMFTEQELCSICSAPGRDVSQLCVVESPADVMALEDATGFRGRYFVLMGHLSPLDGIGPDELGLGQLEDWLAGGEVQELIIATINHIDDEDKEIVGSLYTAAKEIAVVEGIAEHGYRAVMNCNEAAGQTVFHIHLHVLGGRHMGWPPF